MKKKKIFYFVTHPQPPYPPYPPYPGDKQNKKSVKLRLTAIASSAFKQFISQA
jgi:hypothetical protein